MAKTSRRAFLIKSTNAISGLTLPFSLINQKSKIQNVPNNGSLNLLFRLQYSESQLPPTFYFDCNGNRIHATCVKVFEQSLINRETGDEFTYTVSEFPFEDSNHILDRFFDQLPSITLSNISYMLTLLNDLSVNNNDQRHGDAYPHNPFTFPPNYPSVFARHLLQETYGRIVYFHQMAELVNACLGFTHATIFHDLRDSNKRKELYEHESKDLMLPDGCLLWKLIKKYTPLRRNRLIDPPYNVAYKMISQIEDFQLNRRQIT